MTYRGDARHIIRMKAQEIVQRIEERLAVLKLSDRAASLRAGLQPDAIRSIRRGSVPRTDRIERLAQALGVSVEWLLSGAPTADQPTATPAPPPFEMAAPIDMTSGRGSSPSRTRDLPVHGAAGLSDGFIFDGRPREWTARPEALDGAPNGYAVYVRGDSMQPRYLAGELVHVNPNRPITPGCYAVVLIRQDDGAPLRGLIRQYVGQSAETITLRALHPDAVTAYSTDEVAAIHRIVGTSDA
ncbi:S24 family peptidase [Tistrella bauzanensis]|uniref:XRE family transcriptional regulator n=1 Tax=Tistrella TaxID=171436 RepID=UPI0031F6D357